MNEKNKLVVISFLENLLKDYEFEIYVDNSKEDNNNKFLKLNDLQGGNLGGIEQEEFENLMDIVNRLDAYHKNYIYDTLNDRIADKEIIDKSDIDYIAKRFIESDMIAKVLHEVTAKKYKELHEKSVTVDVSDITYIIQAEEETYKNICEKYIFTFSNEMMIENNGEIIHFQISDAFIDLKEEGKININNYKKYLDDYDCVYRYESYKELFESYVELEICNDMENEGLFDENNKWNFYLSYKELKQVNLEYKVQDYYPLIEKHILSSDIQTDFFKHFNLRQLDEFEKALHLYFDTDEIKFDEDSGTITSEKCDFNMDILRLAENLISYDDFIKDNAIREFSPDLITKQKILEYFNEDKIENLSQYGSDRDEGLYKLSSLFSEILDKLDVKYENIYTEDVSDGKYQTTICFGDEQNYSIHSKSKHDASIIAEDLTEVLEEYEKTLENQEEMEM